MIKRRVREKLFGFIPVQYKAGEIKTTGRQSEEVKNRR